jgi:hypothetical protein
VIGKVFSQALVPAVLNPMVDSLLQTLDVKLKEITPGRGIS